MTLWTPEQHEEAKPIKPSPREILCLDHGYVKMVDWMGEDLSIVRSARVSHDAVWRAGQDAGKDEKLIRYLMKHRHTTPFESVVFTFEIKAPILVFRQIHRHRTFSYNELSARYTELSEEFYIPDADKIGIQSEDNKQARDLRPPTQEELDIATSTRKMYEKHCHEAFQHYRNLLNWGWPRELARGVLPVATYSKCFMTGNLHNFFHFLGLRIAPHAQYEIRVFAEAMLEFIESIVPVATKAWRDKQRGEL